MPDLFVIEAPGKKRQLLDLLKSIGIDAAVQATGGHIYSMPDRLKPLGIDSGFREFERKIRNPESGHYLREEAKKADRVFIATDADQEGDVIAWDVAELIADIHPEPYRVRMRGMDEESVQEAISNPDPVRKRDAVAGRTRAIVDRMIGSVFTTDKVVVGRIQTALLGLVDKTPPRTGKLRLVAPSKAGGRPWVAECEMRAPITDKMAARLAAVAFPPLDAGRKQPNYSRPPSNMGDIMVRAGDELEMSPKEAAHSMQKLYEAGRMSYPRASARGMSRGVLRKVAKALQKAGYKFEEDKVAEKSKSEVHDAPYPIGRTEVQRNPKQQGFDEGLRTLVARDLIKSGQAHEIEFGIGKTAADHLSKIGFPADVCELVGKLEWRRENGPRYPGQETWPVSAVIQRRPDTVLLEAAIKSGFGRPSTWANHIEKFMERGLVDNDFNLTDKGREWLAESPSAFLDPRISAAIEQACDKSLVGMMDQPDEEPWEILARKIISALPREVNEPLMKAIADVPVHARENPVAMYVDTVGLDQMLEDAKEKTLNHGPRGPAELPQ